MNGCSYPKGLRSEINTSEFEKCGVCLKSKSTLPAHAIKGSAATAEAEPLSLAATRLEKLCHQTRFPPISKAIDQLAIEFETFVRYVTSLLEEHV